MAIKDDRTASYLFGYQLYQLIYLLLNFSYSEGRDDGSFITRIAKLVASTGKVKKNFQR